MRPSSRSCYATIIRRRLLIMSPPRQISQPAAESPVETAEDEIPDKAEELNTDEIKVKELGAIDPTKRRLELWNQPTSRKLMIQIQQNRVRTTVAEHTDHSARDRCFRS